MVKYHLFLTFILNLRFRQVSTLYIRNLKYFLLEESHLLKKYKQIFEDQKPLCKAQKNLSVLLPSPRVFLFLFPYFIFCFVLCLYLSISYSLSFSMLFQTLPFFSMQLLVFCDFLSPLANYLQTSIPSVQQDIFF